jgi:transcriptional regulator with XRE-family HTH domain
MVLGLLQNYHRAEDMKFHDHLKKLREDKNLTQQQVADAMEISKNTYIGYENGKTQPRVDELKKLSVFYGKTISAICLESDSRNIDKSLVLQFEAVKHFDEEEKRCFNMLVEAMVLKHHARKIEKMSQMYGDGPWEVFYICPSCKDESIKVSRYPYEILKDNPDYHDAFQHCKNCGKVTEAAATVGPLYK